MLQSKSDLEHYLDASSDAAQRSRRLIFLLAIASVLAFSSFWNTQRNSWPGLRYKVICAAGEFMRADSGWIKKSKDSIAGEHGVTVESVEKFMNIAGIHTVQEKEDLKEIYLAMKKESYMVKIPILGAAFDINDLGIITGLTYIILSLLLSFFLQREKENLKITFKEAVDSDLLELCYKRLSMSQILTIPPTPGKRAGAFSYAQMSIPTLFFLPPVLISWLIFRHDSLTRFVGDLFSASKTAQSNLMELIFSLIITAIVGFCIYTSWQIYLLWRHYHRELNLLLKQQHDERPEPVSND